MRLPIFGHDTAMAAEHDTTASNADGPNTAPLRDPSDSAQSEGLGGSNHAIPPALRGEH
jgi:hypothetical protein